MEARNPFDGRRSPMIREVERRERSGILQKSAAVLVVVAAIAAGVGLTLRGGSNGRIDGPEELGGEAPGESLLDRLDREHEEQLGIPPGVQIIGEPDGCVLLDEQAQLDSPLCCPVAARAVGKDPSTCPTIRVGDVVSGGYLLNGEDGQQTWVVDPETQVVRAAAQEKGGK